MSKFYYLVSKVYHFFPSLSILSHLSRVVKRLFHKNPHILIQYKSIPYSNNGIMEAMSAIILLLIRHGETKWNIQRRMQGHTDIPLNSKGRKQSERIALQLKEYPIDIIYSSPFKRALQTATVIQKYHKNTTMIYHDALKERSFGQLEGKTYDEIAKEHPVLSFHRSWNHPYYQIPKGERLADVYQRGIRFLTEISEKHQGTTVAIVSHGVILRCMICCLLQIPLDQNYFYEMENASLTVVKVPQNSPVELQVINNTAYLTDEE